MDTKYKSFIIKGLGPVYTEKVKFYPKTRAEKMEAERLDMLAHLQAAGVKLK